ncbi:hypothetical protein NQ314_017944 [Rhamnusium bicolor]|uniref:Large ribosomal subunit protein eL22 n=1 Tax=Rhamnusium bicolor TaxID=1586634 RepID=A0AAV8WS28_9CUCU|nr:hypothetical protein NQ314_017944 [Rhamnusium bicolor]
MAPATKAAVPATKPQAKKPQIRGKGLKKKKVALKFVIDCTHPVEDSILDVANFERTPSELRYFQINSQEDDDEEDNE